MTSFSSQRDQLLIELIVPAVRQTCSAYQCEHFIK